VGEEDDVPSRVGTPRPKEKAHPTEASAENGDGKKEDDQSALVEEKPEQPPEIPPEIQLRLRKLDKLEPKYTGGLHWHILGRRTARCGLWWVTAAT
jgi:hypothetical protein